MSTPLKSPSSAHADVAVAVDTLSVSYGATPVLDGVDLRLPSGTALAVIGENGAGKSTLLRCVSGLQQPSAGTVLVFAEQPGTGVAFWRRVATTVEAPSWYHGLTVREHLELVRLANGEDPQDGRVREVCDLLGLTDLADSSPITLSSGQRQRFLLAAVFVRPSRLLVLDEPEQRLDTSVKRAIADHLKAYVEAGGSVLLASHDEAFWRGVGASALVLRRPGHS